MSTDSFCCSPALETLMTQIKCTPSAVLPQTFKMDNCRNFFWGKKGNRKTNGTDYSPCGMDVFVEALTYPDHLSSTTCSR